MKDLIAYHQLITGLIIEAEMNGFTHTLEILITELRKVDARIADYTAQMRRKAEFV